MSKRKSKLAFLFLFIPFWGFSQYSFQCVFGSKGNDEGKQVIELNNGNFICIGNSTGYNFSNYISCFNNKGNLLWEKVFNIDGLGIDQSINQIIQASDGNIYLSGNCVLGGDGTPLYTKFDSNGNLIFDTVFELTNGNQIAHMQFIIDDSVRNSLVSFGDGYDNHPIFGYFQKTTYSGKRIYFKFIQEPSKLNTLSFYKTIGENGYTLICDSNHWSDQAKIFMVKIDSSGNVLSQKYLFSTLNGVRFIQNTDGSIINSYTSTNQVPVYEKYDGNGGLIWRKENTIGLINIFHKDSCRYYGIGNNTAYIFDSTMNILDTIDLPIMLSHVTEVVQYSLASDGGVYGIGRYWGGVRDSILDQNDFYFFKTKPDGSFNQNISFMRTGIDEKDIQKQNDILIFPNPSNDLLTIQFNQKDLKISIYNQLGQKMLESFSNEINTSDLAEGPYIIIILDKDGNTISKQTLSIVH